MEIARIMPPRTPPVRCEWLARAAVKFFGNLAFPSFSDQRGVRKYAHQTFSRYSGIPTNRNGPVGVFWGVRLK